MAHIYLPLSIYFGILFPFKRFQAALPTDQTTLSARNFLVILAQLKAFPKKKMLLFIMSNIAAVSSTIWTFVHSVPPVICNIIINRFSKRIRTSYGPLLWYRSAQYIQQIMFSWQIFVIFYNLAFWVHGSKILMSHLCCVFMEYELSIWYSFFIVILLKIWILCGTHRFACGSVVASCKCPFSPIQFICINWCYICRF